MENKSMKSLYSIFLRAAAVFAAAIISLAALPTGLVRASAQASTTIYYGDFGYIIDVDKDTGRFVASICEFKPADTTAASYDITVPETIDAVSYPVTSISANAFNSYQYRDRIKSVKLPNNVTAIGDYAFLECKALEKVDFGTSLLTIGRYAFSGCSTLKEAKLPAKATEIGASAFNNCTSLKSVDLPKTLTYIGQFAFAGCTALESAEIPDSVKSIGSSAFDGCTALKKLVLSKIITSIDTNTFHNCTSLPTVAIPDTVKSISSSAFAGCSSLTAISFPETLESVGSMAFASCKNLTAVIVPYNLNDISDNAFMGSPVEIWGYTGSYADTYAYRNGIRFHSSGSVQRLTFSADNPYVTVNNIAIRSSKGNLVIPPSNVTNGEQLTINVTAPSDYTVDYITINGSLFSNGGTYTVGSTDVDIFVSYKHREATTTSTPEITTVTTTKTPQTTTAPTNTKTETTTITAAPSNDDDDDDDEENDSTTKIEDEGTNSKSYIKVDSDLENINGAKVRIITQRDNFIDSATVRVTNTAEADDAAKSAAEALDIENALYYAFDISIYDSKGKENQGVMAKGTITFQIPVPNDLLPYASSIKVYHIVDETPVFIKSNIIEDINGVKKVQFETDSFSPYMLIASTGDEEITVIDDDTTQPAGNTTDDDDDDENASGSGSTSNGGGNNNPDATIVDDNKTRPNYNGNINPHTGAIIAGTSICVISLVCIPLVKNRRKRKRTKSPVD